MTRTHVILDGLQDPQHGQELSKEWARTGFENSVDVSGQCAWLTAGYLRKEVPELTEADVDRAATVARAFALEVRDRAGSTFVAQNDLQALRDRMAYEYKSRFATALVFVLPALALHYLAPVLAPGAGSSPRDMMYPWLFEAILVGWACIAAGWPILWQGGLALVHLRMTADLFTSLILAGLWLPSAGGVVVLILGWPPWFGVAGPGFYACGYTLIVAVFGRWMAHKYADRIAGRVDLMIRGYRAWLVVWMLLSIGVIMKDWRLGVATAMLLPPLTSLGGVNRLAPGSSAALPVLAFTVVFLLGPRALNLSLEGVQVEIAFLFSFLMTLVHARGWARFKT